MLLKSVIFKDKWLSPKKVFEKDFEKAFDSLNHKFLIAVLKKHGFGEDFIDWVKILSRNQESCLINGGHTSRHFRMERGDRQGDPIS